MKKKALHCFFMMSVFMSIWGDCWAMEPTSQRMETIVVNPVNRMKGYVIFILIAIIIGVFIYETIEGLRQKKDKKDVNGKNDK